jgi:hypothetical protein
MCINLGFCSRSGSPRIGAAPIFALDVDERGLGEGEGDIVIADWENVPLVEPCFYISMRWICDSKEKL